MDSTGMQAYARETPALNKPRIVQAHSIARCAVASDHSLKCRPWLVSQCQVLPSCVQHLHMPTADIEAQPKCVQSGWLLQMHDLRPGLPCLFPFPAGHSRLSPNHAEAAAEATTFEDLPNFLPKKTNEQN